MKEEVGPLQDPRRLERLTTLYEDELRLRQATRIVAAAILESRPLHEIAALITETIARQLNEERVALLLHDASGTYRPVALRNISTAFGDEIIHLAQPMPALSRATATGLPHYLRNIQEEDDLDAETRRQFQREKITTVLLALLQHDELLRGALLVYPQRERHFTPAELNIFQGFADMATLGIAITQQFEQERQIAAMEERNRLAREMHDTVAQSLAGLLFQIETAQTSLDAGDRETAREMLGSARALARQTLDETRRAVQGLSPASLEHLSPVEAIAEEARQFEAQAGVVTQFIRTGEERELSADQRVTLLRIVQESLSNIRKHAQARRVRIGLQYGPEAVTLLIEDDGIGFDVEARAAPGAEGGYGLFGMSERARLVGGEVRIESTLGWGTCIRATLPYLLSASSPRPALPSLLQEASEAVSEGERASSALPAPGERTEFGLRITEGSYGFGRQNPALLEARPESPPTGTDAPEPSRLRVLIAEDQAMVRQGIRAMLEASGEIEVIGEAENGEQAAERARALRPDVVLMDIQMPRVDGLEGLRRIHAAQPELSVVILTTFLTDEAIREALGAGAKGYLLKDAEPADLIASVRAAARGETLLSAAVTERLSALASGQAKSADTLSLNEREREVLTLLTQGARNKEIAAQLFITTSTVEYHLSNIFVKLGVSNRTEAVRVALEHGLAGRR